MKGRKGKSAKVIKIRHKMLSGKSKWIVTPGRVRVAAGDRITFDAAGTAAILLIPMPDLFEAIGAYGVSSGVLTIFVRKDGTVSLRVKETGRAKRRRGQPSIECRYAVYCSADGDFAKGNSSPVIIIEPPSLGGG